MRGANVALIKHDFRRIVVSDEYVRKIRAYLIFGMSDNESFKQ